MQNIYTECTRDTSNPIELEALCNDLNGPLSVLKYYNTLELLYLSLPGLTGTNPTAAQVTAQILVG